MTPEQTAELALVMLRGGKFLLNTLSAAELEQVTPELRAKLHGDRDTHNARFDDLFDAIMASDTP